MLNNGHVVPASNYTHQFRHNDEVSSEYVLSLKLGEAQDNEKLVIIFVGV